jgi:2-amino-4-hydroxy-6-hydroxymethyldihydropteridine diphosphokinase
MTEALLLLGSNIEPEKNMPAALEALRNMRGITLLTASPTYQSPAIGADGLPAAQPEFHNAAVHIRTDLSVRQLRAALRDMEARLGRVRTNDKYAPRPIDIDIAFYGSSVVEVDGTVIPDPDIERQPHVALPLAAIAPDWRHPLSGMTLRQIAGRLANQEMEIVRL